MATTRNCTALTVHGLGWVALLAAVVVVRTGVFHDGWPTWSALTVGVLVFAACEAWSVSAILDRIQVIEATSQSRVIRSTPPYSERLCSFPGESNKTVYFP